MSPVPHVPLSHHGALSTDQCGKEHPRSPLKPQRRPHLPPAQLRTVSTPRNVPCPNCLKCRIVSHVPLSHMSHCPTLLYHQQINAGTRHDLLDICSLQTRPHSVIHRTQLIQLIQPSLGLSSFGDGWRML